MAAPTSRNANAERPADEVSRGEKSTHETGEVPEAEADDVEEAPELEPQEDDDSSPAPVPGSDARVLPGDPTPGASSLGAGLHALVFQRPGLEQPVNYLLFLPRDYESRDRWPLIVYLHGRSHSGDDLQLLTRYGIPKIVSRDPTFPFVVVAPQVRVGKRWTDVDTLDALLAEALSEYHVDPDRVYLTGYSMGAGGAWRFGGARPHRFAAIAAIAGVAEPQWAKGLARVPVWAFHGTADDATPASASETMVAAIRAAGGEARLELLQGRGHEILDVYDRDDLYAWFLSHRRRR
jgi:pimeloyl-ACP methyl ester carboxylesterase